MPESAAVHPSFWRQESLHLARSGTLLAFNQLLQLAIPFVTTAMAGRIGVEALAAGSMVGSIALLLFISSLGIMQGLVPVVSISLGAGDRAAAARTIRGGLLIAVTMGLGTTAIMACVPWALARAGQDPALVAIAKRYVLALLPGYLPSVVSIALRFFLIASHDLKWLNPIIIVCIAFNVGCNLLLASGWGHLDGITAIGLTITATSWLMLIMLAAAMSRSQRAPKGILEFRAGFALRDALKLGIPVGAIFFTENLMFAGSSVMMGYFGKVPLAAHGIVTLWLNIALMIPIGISQAAMARVASLVGQRDAAALRHAVLVSLVGGSAVSIAIGAILVSTSDHLVILTMSARSVAGGEVADVAHRFFRFCAIVQLFSGLLIVMASILRGLRDSNAVLWLVMLAYWGIGLGGAILFAFVLGFGPSGIWIGITLAFAFAVTLMATRFRRALAKAT